MASRRPIQCTDYRDHMILFDDSGLTLYDSFGNMALYVDPHMSNIRRGQHHHIPIDM